MPRASLRRRGQIYPQTWRNLAKAEALKKYGEAALVQELIERLPEIVRAAAEPIASIQAMTVVSTEGASPVTKSVASVLGEGQGVVKQLTGVDINQLIAGIASGQLGGEQPASTNGTAGTTTLS